jgi:hypothetical protein
LCDQANLIIEGLCKAIVLFGLSGYQTQFFRPLQEQKKKIRKKERMKEGMFS